MSQSILFKELTISRMTLGGAQFGMRYGIANREGRPGYERVRDIIGRAFEMGVTCLDTAAAYGDSEEVIGRALHDLGIADRVLAVTKLHPVKMELSEEEALRFAESFVNQSRSRLNLDVLPVCMLHHDTDLPYVGSLMAMKERGLVRHIGSSILNPDCAAPVIRSGLMEVIQAPMSMLDHRFKRNGFLAECAERGIVVFARSVYLQGLILMPEEEIPPELSEVIPVRRRLNGIAREAGISMAEMAVRYVLSLEGITSLVTGVDTVEQLLENATLIEKGPLPPDLMREIEEAVPDLPDRILMPNKWSARVPDVGPVKY